jgi:histidine triad (HIT) family protein
MSDDCIFCKIVAGEIPATKIYEDDQVLAFMDIGPIIKGHALVIPKKHYDPLMATPDDVLARCIAVARQVAKAQQNELGADGVNLHQANGAAAGQEVAHLHFHVIPRYKDDGHHWNWNAGKYDSMDEMIALGRRLQSALES